MNLTTELPNKNKKLLNSWMMKFKAFMKINFLLIAILFISISSVIMLIIYFKNVTIDPSTNSIDWGNFGSYFASITGLLAFAGVLYTVKQSNDRSDKTDIETVKREERDLFFKLLELHKDKLNSITYTENNHNNTGLNALEMYLNFLNNILVEYHFNYCIVNMEKEDFDKLDYYIDIEMNIIIQCNKINALMNGKKSYSIDIINPLDFQFEKLKTFINDEINSYKLYDGIKYYTSNLSLQYKEISKHFICEMDKRDMYLAMKIAGSIMNIEYGQVLGQYFKNMYYLLTIIKQFNYNENDKNYYFKLFRAQLSRSEIIICLFNSLSYISTIKYVTLLDDNKILNDMFFTDLYFTNYGKEWIGNEKEFIKSMFLNFRDERL